MADATSPPGMSGTQGQDESQVREKAQEVAGQAQEKAQEAAGKARGVVSEKIDERSTQAGEQVSSTAEDLRSVGEELRKQGKEGPAKYADKGAEQVERVGSYLKEADADSMLSDIEDFGRRQPLAVLAGGLVLGMAAARFLKSSSHGRYQSRIGSQSDSQTRQLGTAAAPLPDTAGTTAPGEPVTGRQPAPLGTPTATPPESPVPTGPAAGR
ncbi:MAG TPA: hypothetical protein VHF50_08230 [Solirubrobacterales bacterium]|nr:hypothetical protein [Solirubrobacterales bacterium]